MRIIAAALVAGVFLAAGIACSESGDDVTKTPSEGESGADFQPYYEPPILLAPGDYADPAFDWEGYRQRGLAAVQEKSRQTLFEGTVNGFTIYTFEHAIQDPTIEKSGCAPGELAGFPETNLLRFDYLPDGTYARSPQYAGRCADGTTTGVTQQFATKHGGFDITYIRGERAFSYGPPAGDVEEALVGGREAIIIHPVTEEGFGRSWVAVATKQGLFLIDALDLPEEQTIKIAAGIACEEC